MLRIWQISLDNNNLINYNHKGEINMNIRNEIKAHIAQEGTTMSEVVRTLAVVHGWSASVPNLSDKLKRGTLRYNEAIELADILGYDIIWQKRGGRHGV